MPENRTSTSVADGRRLLCPVCRVDLVMRKREGIGIGCCPGCRGAWLDRTELDKIIARNAEEKDQTTAPRWMVVPERHALQRRGYDGGQSSGHDHDDRHDNNRHHESFLGRLFD